MKPGVFLSSCLFGLLLLENVFADCVWYGECGHQDGAPDQKLDCQYNGPAFPMTNKTGRGLLAKLCPQFAVGDYETCCDTNQLNTLDTQFAVPRQLLSRCPSCLKNFLNLWCEMTCSPNHDKFVGVPTFGGTKDYKGKSFVNATKSVVMAAFHVSLDFAVGMYNSCRNVEMPSSYQKAISVLCGMSADQCNASKWLNFLGNEQINPATPFQIAITAGNNNITYDFAKPTAVLMPMNFSTFACNKSIDNDSLPCSCQDCIESCAKPVPPTPPPKPFTILGFPGPFYRIEQLIITPTDKSQWNHTKDFPYQFDQELIGPVFRPDFLHQVLDLQLAIENIEAKNGNRTVTLQDVCYKPLEPDNMHCTIQSPLQYFQNSHEMLKKTVIDRFSRRLADYISHLKSCTNNPFAVQDASRLDTSCMSLSGQPISPWVVLGGYNGTDYLNATAIGITFVLKNHVNDSDNIDAETWEKEFLNFMENYSNPDFIVSYSAEEAEGDDENKTRDDLLETGMVTDQKVVLDEPAEKDDGKKVESKELKDKILSGAGDGDQPEHSERFQKDDKREENNRKVRQISRPK